MTLKHWALVGGAVACLISSFTDASPWFEPGDSYARFRLQQQADTGKLDTVITTWPLARSNAKSVAGSGQPEDTWLWNELAGKTGGSVDLLLGASSSPDMIRDFSGDPRDQAILALNAEYIGDKIALALNPTYVNDPADDESVRLDGSYIATTFNNWAIGAGALNRWWGPGWHSSLILSDNARPVPQVWIERRNTYESENPWLSWLGPWSLVAFAGRLENERSVPDANLIGMRFTFRPVSGLEIGLSRLMQWGGKGQPNSASSFWDSFVGNDNEGANGKNPDPGNQLAGIDLRYGFNVGEQTVGVYTQVVGEDEAGYLPSRKIYQFGIDWTTSFLSANQQWYLEGVDTLSEGLFGGQKRPNYAYEHFNYRSGMRYLGRNLASTFDADARAITLGGYHFTSQSAYWHAAVTWANLNRDGGVRFEKGQGKNIDYFVAMRDQELVIFDLGYSRPLPLGAATIKLSIASDAVDLADDEVKEVQGAIEWRIPLQ